MHVCLSWTGRVRASVYLGQVRFLYEDFVCVCVCVCVGQVMCNDCVCVLGRSCCLMTSLECVLLCSLCAGDYSVLLVTLYGGAAYYKQLMLMFTTCREW